MKRNGVPTPELMQQVEATISDAYYDARNAGRTMTQAAKSAAANLVAVIASVDENAHNRGRTDVASWVDTLHDARNLEGPGLIALCRLLVDDDTAPPALHAIADRVLDARLYRVERPRARNTDPGTSKDAAAGVPAAHARPGGKVHRILAAYHEATRPPGVDNYPHGMTALEVEFVANVREAHKRTSELLADGLLEVVPIDDDAPPMDSVDLVRKGGRVLRITTAGREELARLDDAARNKAERDRARQDRAAARKLKAQPPRWCARSVVHGRHTWNGGRDVCLGSDRYGRRIDPKPADAE